MDYKVVVTAEAEEDLNQFPNCGRKMKQQFIGLQHCKCGMSWKRDIGFFERTPDMVFCLRRNVPGRKPSRIIEIRYKQK